MITKEVKYDLLQNVLVVPLNVKGKVIQISIGIQYTEYQVRYFDHAEAKSVWFMDNELLAIDNKEIT